MTCPPVAWSVSSGVSTFSASYQGADVRLEWTVTQEPNVIRYDLYRKRGGEHDFQKITSQLPAGQTQYWVVDDNLYKNEAGPANVEYRLTVVSSGQETHYYAVIEHNPTAIQRSWGSIKSMFR